MVWHLLAFFFFFFLCPPQFPYVTLQNFKSSLKFSFSFRFYPFLLINIFIFEMVYRIGIAFSISSTFNFLSIKFGPHYFDCCLFVLYDFLNWSFFFLFPPPSIFLLWDLIFIFFFCNFVFALAHSLIFFYISSFNIKSVVN